MSLFASKHGFQGSLTNQDSSSLETVNAEFRLMGGMQVGHSTPEFFRSSQETGQESHLEQSAPTPVAVTWTKSLELAADTECIPYFLYWATQGGAATLAPGGGAIATVASSSPAAYEHEWKGPNIAYVARAFSAEDLGDLGGSDADYNRSIHNVTPERVTITGKRSNTSDAVLRVQADVRGGGATASAGAGTSVTYVRTKLFNFGMIRVLTIGTTGFGTEGASYFNGATLPTSDANCVTLSLLQSPVAATPAVQEFSIIATQNLDLNRSMAPGNLDANFAAYVPASTDWVYTNEAQQLEFEFLFTEDHSTGSNFIEGLGLEVAAGTRRSWEFWIVHPGADTAPTPDVYYGIKITCASMVPVSWKSENDGMGERYVRVRYRAGWDTSKDYGWHITAMTSFATSIGG